MPIPSVIPGQSTSSAILNHSSHKRSRSSTLEIENSRKKNKVEDSLKKRRKRKRRKVSVVVGSPVSSDRAQIMETVLGSPSGQHSHQEDRATESDSPLDSLTASADGSNPASRDVESSLVTSSKGKTKASPPRVPNPPVPSSPSPSEIIARMAGESAKKTALIEKHQTLLNSIHQTMTCQVCLDLMHKPYALSPCGHLSCYDCLVQWFNAAPPGANPTGLNHHRKKTCPHCRAIITERPAEVWGIKTIVAGICKSGLVPNLTEPPPANATADGNVDPWEGIFPKPVVAADAWDERVGDMGILDMEDGAVFRCRFCMHEIWDGVCTSCGREYPGHRGAGFFGASWSSDDDDDDEEMSMAGVLPPPRVGQDGGWPPFDGSDDDLDDHRFGRAWGSAPPIEEHEDGYESSFIDDGQPESGTLHPLSQAFSPESSDEELEEAPRWRRITSAIGGRRVVNPTIETDVEDASDEEGRDAVNGTAPQMAGGRGRMRIIDSDDEEDMGHIRWNDASDEDSDCEGSDGSSDQHEVAASALGINERGTITAEAYRRANGLLTDEEPSWDEDDSDGGPTLQCPWIEDDGDGEYEDGW